MIGIVDWGIGGLSVYRAMRHQGQTSDVLYFSDSGSVPYGKQSRSQLRERLGQVARFYADRGVKEVLVACHAASSALESGEHFEGVAFRSIIPAAVRVVERSAGRRLGVIGGQFTISSHVYQRALDGLGKDLQFLATQPLSAFVEAGELDSPAVEAEIGRLLESMPGIDALLLACTHYPALGPVFRRIGGDLELLDPGAEMAQSGRAGWSFLRQAITNIRPKRRGLLSGSRSAEGRGADVRKRTAAVGIRAPLLLGFPGSWPGVPLEFPGHPEWIRRFRERRSAKGPGLGSARCVTRIH